MGRIDMPCRLLSVVGRSDQRGLRDDMIQRGQGRPLCSAAAWLGLISTLLGVGWGWGGAVAFHAVHLPYMVNVDVRTKTPAIEKP